VYFDTAGAAESLAQEKPAHIGAIASAYAAELYGLKVLRRNLQNQPNNFTRFLAVARAPLKPIKAGPSGRKSSIVFMPARNQVGVLFNILGVFALRGIDLLKIESRPNPLSPFEYWFYVDFAGGEGEPGVDQALDQLRGMASELKLLGSYPASAPAAGRAGAPSGRKSPGKLARKRPGRLLKKLPNRHPN
jgi:prephenate dehydratase